MTIKNLLASIMILLNTSVMTSLPDPEIDEKKNVSSAITHAVSSDNMDSFFKQPLFLFKR